MHIYGRGSSLAVHWLGLCALTAERPGSISGQGTKIPQATAKKSKTKPPNLWSRRSPSRIMNGAGGVELPSGKGQGAPVGP